ncbi:Aminomethyltransferase [bacterium YEK0313]|nr:Aminomethyltransferase [bacterium YEK0313]
MTGPGGTTGGPFRLAAGGLVDRGRPLAFSFDGRRYQGLAGDTLASALVANGVRLVGRSFKYHRPRGLLSAGPEEPNGLVELRPDGARREPNSRATTVELHDGLAARSQNRWPSLGFDLMAVNGLAAPLIKAGFYYKTFMWPAAFWEKVYEPLIRRAAGLGRAAEGADPDHYEKAHLFCDLLVVGSGPAGLMAALAAGRAGARVVLCEEDFRLGGRLIAERTEVGGMSGADWVAGILAELDSLDSVVILKRTTVYGAYDHGTFGAVERVSDHLAAPPAHAPRQRAWRIVAKRVVLAAGAIERPLVFGDNDRPGVMLAGAVRTYLNRFGALPGRTAVIFANNDAAAMTALDLAAAGAHVAAIVDPREEPGEAMRAADEAAGARLIAGREVTRAWRGRRDVSGVEILAGGDHLTLGCDLVAMSGGWNPTLHLASHRGHRPVWDEARAAFVPGDLPRGLAVAGAAGGAFGLSAALAEGARAGVAAAAALGFAAAMPNLPETADASAGHRPLWRVTAAKGKSFVDFQNDVTGDDVALAEREGFRAIEHLKRYTTLGMATDQGKTANVNGLAIMAALTEKAIPATGTTTFRPPYTPVALGALAGHHRGPALRPVRLPPAHRVAERRGAVFVEAGAWMRAQYFPRAGETDWLETVSREVTTVRGAAGICDVSTLGKIDIQGADAAAFLERIYVNGWKGLAVGKARYGVMLREDGFVLDDGTTARLGERHFLMTTTTANAAKVMQHLEFCAEVLWPELDVHLASVSDQWAQFAIAGPRSRALVAAVVDAGHDVSREAMPFLAARAVTVGGGVPARLFCLSFSGELAYELAVPAAYGAAALEALLAAGEPLGACAYGTEAMAVMRIEKGHVAGGELNGQTTLGDLGLGRLMSAKKDCIGKVMATRPGLTDPDRLALAGFRPVDRSQRLRAGAHFIPLGVAPRIEADEGHMTSAAFSPTLGHWIGLGLVRRGAARQGERLRAYDPVRGGDVEVEICSPVFVDPEGSKLHG